jgi:hypothetical protein
MNKFYEKEIYTIQQFQFQNGIRFVRNACHITRRNQRENGKRQKIKPFIVRNKTKNHE